MAAVHMTEVAETSAERFKVIVGSLQARLGDGFDTEVLAEEVGTEFARYAGSRVTQFVPILVERQVRARLSAGSNTVDVGLPDDERATSPQSQRRTR